MTLNMAWLVVSISQIADPLGFHLSALQQMVSKSRKKSVSSTCVKQNALLSQRTGYLETIERQLTAQVNLCLPDRHKLGIGSNLSCTTVRKFVLQVYCDESVAAHIQQGEFPENIVALCLPTSMD